MLKSANFEKSVFPCPISLADFRDSISLTSSNFFLTSSPPFYKKKSNVSLEDIVLYRHTRTLELFWILSKKYCHSKTKQRKVFGRSIQKTFFLCAYDFIRKSFNKKEIFPIRQMHFAHIKVY